MNLDDGHVVPVSRDLQRLLITRSSVPVHVQHVRKHESCAFFLDSIGQEPQSLAYVGAVRLWLQLDYFPDYVQQMASAFLWRNELLDFIAEEQCAHFIVIDYGRKT